MGRAAAWARGMALRPTLLRLVVVVLLLAAGDAGSQLAGDSVLPGGPVDETAHLMTTLLLLWALGRMVDERLIVPALVASVAIDADHIPQHLGTQALTAGTPRPYTHSLLMLVLLGVGAVLWRRRRWVLLGLCLGVTIHLWRDLSEPGSGVALLWPLSDRGFALPHWSYVAAVIVATAVAAARIAATGAADSARTAATSAAGPARIAARGAPSPAHPSSESPLS